ncbi:golgin subfamily A member 5-like isoform X2 [Dysidea avara]|uniref:golgin subfamily A member 5-like isoform X2 n=1 Tax=Dysidea avara TaxID=196820 RepID=UPI00332926FE
MSWFSELAGKAEAFLDRVDQATATTLQNVQSPSRDVPGHDNAVDSRIGELQRINRKEGHGMDSTRSSSMSDLQSMVKTQPKVPRDLARVGHSGPVKYFTPGSSRQRSAPPNDATSLKNDDNWLEYLNTPTNSDKETTNTSIVMEHDNTATKNDNILNKEVPAITITDDDDTDAGDVTAHVVHMPDQQVGQESVLQDKLSNMELENTLLRGEVKLLNTELAKANKKLKEMQESTARHQHDAMLAKEQSLEKEQLLRQLRGREEDLTASVTTKTSQLAAIKTLLEETQSALEQEREKSKTAMVEKERLVEDASQSSGLQAQAMDSLQEKLRQLQTTIDQERAASVQAKNEHSHKERQLTQQLQTTSDTLHKTEAQVKQLQVNCSENINNLRACQTELETSRQQHLDYKQRATNILQAKEKLITSLQDGQSGGGVSEALLEQNKMEKRMIEQQLSNAEQQLQQLRTELSELEGSSSAQLDHVSSQLRDSEKALNRESHQHNETRALLSHAKEELSRCNEEMVQFKVTSSIQLKDKEQDIQALQEKVAAISRSPAHSEQVELETRLQELTESLIEKQTSLETLHSERNSLQLQLDRAKSQLAEMEQSHKNIITHHHNAVSISGLDGSAEMTRDE